MNPYPDEPTFWAQFEISVQALYAEAGRVPDLQAFRWFSRTGYDCASMDAQTAAAKHLAELRSALGLVTPTDPNHLKGAFCIPAASGRVWWPAFLAVSDAEQDRYIAETLARRYTFGQVLVSGLPYANDYPRIEPDANRLLAGLSKMKAAGLTTIVAFDDSRGPDLSYLRPILEPSASLIDWCMGIYECNGVFKDAGVVLDVLKQARALLPAVHLAVHFTPLDEGEESYGLVDWHRAQAEANLNALFFQSAAWRYDVPTVAARVADFTRRLMNGMNGYPILSHGVNVFELSTTKTYRNEWTEAQAVALTDAVMNAPLTPDGGVMAVKPNGFGDGGTV